MVKTSDNKTHQIDHIIVSKYGIFVIETKQYNGYIKGNDYDKRWLIKNGNKNFYVNNPLHQNYGHVKSLHEVLNIPEENFVSLVCIPSRAKVSVKSKNVTRIYDLLEKIYSYKEELPLRSLLQYSVHKYCGTVLRHSVHPQHSK